MKTWTSVTAEELIVKRSGSIDPKKFPDEVFELFSIPAFDCNEPEILTGQQIGSSKICIEPGDVLLSRIVPHIRRCWIVPTKSSYRQMGSGEWIIFRDHRFHPNFLKHFLTSDYFHNQFMNTVAGVGGSLLRARPAQVAQIKIPLPPLEEQKRIAAILDKADAIHRKRQQAIQLADDFLRAVFLDMFGDPVVNPKNWPVKRIEDIAAKQKYSIKAGPFGSALKKEDYVPEGYKIYGQEQVIRDDLDFGDYFIDTRKYESLASCAISEGDMLISLVGSFGKVSVVPEKFHPGIINPRLMKIHFDSTITDPWFMKYLLTTKEMLRKIEGMSHGGTMGILNVGKIKVLETINPPLKLQKKFIEIKNKAKTLTSKSSKEPEHLLDCSLSQKAFRGEL